MGDFASVFETDFATSLARKWSLVCPATSLGEPQGLRIATLNDLTRNTETELMVNELRNTETELMVDELQP